MNLGGYFYLKVSRSGVEVMFLFFFVQVARPRDYTLPLAHCHSRQ